MTSDITCDATVEYIIDNEQHLDLAFRVEEAMPIVRKRLVEKVKCLAEKVVKDVEKKFSKSDCWKVFPTGYGDVMEEHKSLIVLRKNSWYEHYNNDEWTGIHLSSYGNFSRPYVCLHLDKTYIVNKEEYIIERFKGFETKGFKTYEHARTDGRSLKDLLCEGIMWKDVPGDWDCQNKNFFKNSLIRAANSEKPEEIVERFAHMIKGMAEKIDDTMKNLGRNA